MFSRIAGTGSHLPPVVLTNQDIENIVDTTEEWIFERTGIKQRHIVSEGQTTVDLAEKAALAAIKAAGRTPQDIDLIILATTTPTKIFPSTACLLQQRLDIHGCPAFDVQAVCTGFIYALGVADKFIQTNSAKCALVVGAETMSRVVDWNDRATCILFGDGAGAVVLEKSEKAGIISTHLHADGSYEDYLHVPRGVSQGCNTALEADSAYIRMRGNEVFKMAVNTLSQIVEETLAANNITKSNIDWLIPHQANIRIINATAKKLGMSTDQVIITVAEHGNTSAASVPLALDIGIRDGRIKRDQLLLLEAFGGGFTWGSALICY